MGGVGFAPVAPGTFGSMAGVLLFLAVCGVAAGLRPVPLLEAHGAVALVVSGLGVWASGRCERAFGQQDDGRIVIDEVAGQLISLTPVLVLGAVARDAGVVWLASGSAAWWALVVTAFVTFRGFDITKPGPVRWAEERFDGGLGVMADDWVAGGLAALAMTVPCYALLLVAVGGAVGEGGA